MSKKRKHKALEEKYDHFVCERCMEIGAKEVITEFTDDLKKDDDFYTLFAYRLYIDKIIKKWVERLK